MKLWQRASPYKGNTIISLADGPPVLDSIQLLRINSLATMNRSSQYIHKRLSSLNPYQDHNGRKGRRRGRARKNPLAFPDATPTRRISTAAGQRLEEILDTDSSGTKKQGIQQVQNDRSNRFLPTSKYLSLLSEENDEAEVRGDSKVTVKSLPDRASTDQSTDNLVCEKAKNPEGYEIGQNLLLLRQKRKKLAMIFSVILAIMVGLAVGLGVGLGNINRKWVFVARSSMLMKCCKLQSQLC